jgi:hypothetical protein
MPKYSDPAKQARYEEYLRLKQEKARVPSAQPREEAAAPIDNSNAPQAALEGFGETATMGYLPQIQAAVEPAQNKLMELITGKKVDSGDYLQRRDENLRRQKSLSEENPMASMAGKLAGGVASSAILPGGAAGGIGKAALQGAATGALYNPGDKEGEMGGLQLADRGTGAMVGGAVGGTMGALQKGVSALSNKQNMVNRVKDSATLGDSVKGEIDTALENVTKNQVKPRVENIKQLLKGQDIDVNPEQLKGINPQLDRIAELATKRGMRKAPEQAMYDVSQRTVDKVALPANRANAIKRALDQEAKYAQNTAWDPRAAAKAGQAKSASDALRSQINQNPDVATINEELQGVLAKQGHMKRLARSSPISSIQGKPGTDRGSLLDWVDKASGSKLEKLGNEITGAKGMLLKPSNLIKPLEAPNEVRKILGRAGMKAGSLVDAATPKGTADVTLRSLLESLREK